MAAPRLLDKRVVSAEVANQKKQQIDTGITIAKKVDAVRETLQEEETRLEIFREETLKRVQSEIDSKIREREHLENEISRRREERIQLEAPIDLKDAWNEVQSGKIEINNRRDNLTNQLVQQTAREGELEKSEENLAKRNSEISQKEKLSDRTLRAAEDKFEEASSVLDKAKTDSKRLFDIAAKKEKQVVQREIEADERDALIVDREQEVSKHEIDLSNREQALKVKYETFVKAQAYISSKKKQL